ncbi:MAG: hypothetical protein AAGF94_07540 [Pseudomonadota bacterium]
MKDPFDPKGLIAEAFRIEGIGDAECRSILVDWAMSLPSDTESAVAIDQLYKRYAADHPGHPMTGLLQEGRGTPRPSARRGGARGRRGGSGG